MSISPVHVNGFHQATDHPCPQKNHMVTENNNPNKKASSKDECFQRMCIFCLHSKWRLERDNRQGTVTIFSFLYSQIRSTILQCSPFPITPQDYNRTNGTMLWAKGMVGLNKGCNTRIQLLSGKTVFQDHKDQHSISDSKHFTTS